MNAERSTLAGPARRLHSGLLTGVTWKGLGLIALICVINGLRRVSPGVDGDEFVFSLDWLMQIWQFTLLGLMVAIPVTLAVVGTYNLTPPKPLLRYPAIAVAVALSCAAGVVASVVNCGDTSQACLPEGLWQAFSGAYARYGLLSAMFTVVFVYLRAADESAERAREAEAARARFVQRMEEARLKMLQAQIEPHFLFNTLANVRRLYQTAPADAATMLDNLMRYLEVALPQMRSNDSTLGREVELTESYLNIQRIRMGQRLAFHIDIPSSLRDVRLPPMMLLTLAENAIKHGLAPLPEGGIVQVRAAVHGGELEVRVADSGRGFAQSSGGGTGLANIRARLTATYGAAGRLALAANMPHGVSATITVPLTSTAVSP